MTLPTARESYASLVGEVFTLDAGGGVQRRLTLSEVKPRIDDEVQLCYSLLFRGEGDTLPECTYTLSHPRLGEFPLFLVPIRKGKGGVLYEAVFNLLKDADE